MLNKSTSLKGRVTRSLSILITLLACLFSLLVVFISYALEDEMFKQDLVMGAQAITQGKPLPSNMQLLNDLSQFENALNQQLTYIEFETSRFGEFSFNERHYHFLQMNAEQFLVYDVTSVAIVNRAMDDILIMISVILILSLTLGVVASRFVAKYMLKPFTTLTTSFIDENIERTELRQSLEEIKEQDVRQIATQLVDALENQAQMIKQQQVFNQGMSHELRTPLQVMTHSLELLSATDNTLATKPAFVRLEKSTERMRRLSNALLWLTSSDEYQHCHSLSPVINDISEELQPLFTVQSARVAIVNNSTLSWNMPEVVIETIISNLMQNFIQHSQNLKEDKCLTIEIDTDSICFRNRVVHFDSQNKGFGLGLQLVIKLLERFYYKADIIHSDGEFAIIIKQQSIASS